MERDPKVHLEENSSQKPAIELLEKLKYRYISPKKAEELRENNLNRVLLKPILEKKLKELNSFEYKEVKYKFSEKNIQQAMLDLDEPLIDGLIKTSEKIYDHLLLGKSYEERLEDGAKKSFSLKYIDWNNVENNDFHITEEYRVEKIDGETRIPDIVLFINGIPIVVIECKKAAVNILEGISQTIRNQGDKEIPQLFKFTQLLMSMNKNFFKYATTGTPDKFWSVWKSDRERAEKAYLEDTLAELISERLPTEQDKAILSLLLPERLLELIKYFLLYDKNEKKIARYQQYYSVKETMRRIKTFDEEGKRKGGLIWHTQGSGKSLTMVMLAKSLMLDDDVLNPKVVIVTDRINLDKQIKNTFSHTGMKPVRATTGQHLIKTLKEDKANIITTVINKFEAVLNEKQINNDKNIFVLIDESHRTQYGELHIKMKKVFPMACYIGFTGTPLMKKDKNSMIKFGGEIHRYTIDQAVKDGSVLPLLYEGKMIDQDVNRNAIDRRLEMITKNLNEKQKEEVKQKWSKFEKVASSYQRLELVAFDINEHYTKNWQNTEFKAMLACNSRPEAIKYKQAFDEIGDINTAVVMSPPDTREGHSELNKASKNLVKEFWADMMKKYGKAEAYEESIKDDFINGDEIDVLIVIDKLLTGFDAPKATILYIDKNLRDHNLLQAIARVNRLYEGKEFGHIIDYRGLLGNLDKALTDYSEAGLDNFESEDLVGALQDVREIIAKLRTVYSQLLGLFNSIQNKNDVEEYEVYLEDREIRDKFYNLVSKFSRYLSIAFSSEKIYNELEKGEINRYKKDLKFFQELRRNVKLRYSDGIDHKEYEAKLQKLLDNYVTAEEVIRVTKPIDIFDKESFQKELTRVTGDRAKGDTIRTRMSQKISEKYDENPAYYKKFSKRIEEVLEAYRSKRISDAEYFYNMEDLKNEFYKGDTAKEYPEDLKNNGNAKAFYDNLSDIFSENKIHFANSIISDLALKVDEIIRYRVKVDWRNNNDIHKQIEQDLDDLFFDFSEEAGIKIDFDTIDAIIEKMKSIALKRYKD